MATLLEGAAFFTAVHGRLEHATKAAATKSARLIRDEARRVLGTYDYGWVPLAESTVESKVMGDSPGLETEKMRRSIKYKVYGERMHWNAAVGSDLPRALYFELGTISQPARSFLAGAAMRMEHRVHEICGHDLFQSIFSLHYHHPDFDNGEE